MNNLIELLEENLEGISKDQQKKIAKFVSRLASYQHVPIDTKAFMRMDKFAQDLDIVNFLVNGFQIYLADMDDDNYDIVPFWYCLTILTLAKNHTASENLIKSLTKNAVNKTNSELWMYRRHFRIMPKERLDVFSEEKELLEEFFIQNEPKYQAHQLANQIGLELPKDDTWYINFRIKSTNSSFHLSVDIHPLFDDGSWKIILRNDEGLHAIWSELSNLINPRCLIKNHEEKSLLNFHHFIKLIEETYTIEFDLDTLQTHFKGRIKKKNQLSLWLKQSF